MSDNTDSEEVPLVVKKYIYTIEAATSYPTLSVKPEGRRKHPDSAKARAKRKKARNHSKRFNK